MPWLLWRHNLTIQKYFCKNGLVIRNYDWYLMFEQLYYFKLYFKFTYLINRKVLVVKYIPEHIQFKNKVKFLKLMLKQNREYKITELSLPNLFNCLKQAKNNIFKYLIK